MVHAVRSRYLEIPSSTRRGEEHALSGVEPSLLHSAFEIARAGTIASEAVLEIEDGPIVVKCQECGASSAAKPNRLLCQYCGEWRVNVVEGEELLLLSLDIETRKMEEVPLV